MKKSTQSINLLFVGRIDRQKGIDILIDALRNSDFYKSFNLRVIGNSVVDPVVSMKSFKNITFLGWKNHNTVNNEMEKADIIVIPSRWEGFGLVTLEAMKHSKMVLASDAGALPEIVIDGKTGFVFKSNSIKSLKSILNKVCMISKDDINNMGENGKERYKRVFNYEKMANKVMDLYKDIN